MRSVSLVALVAFLVSSPAFATSVAPLALPELAQRSTQVVHGEVVSTESRWNEDRTLIVTDVTIRVDEALAGDAAGTVTFTQPGGRVGALRVDVPGAAAFRAGEEGIWFLAPGGRGTLHLNGLDRGRYAVTTDPETGEKRIRGIAASDLEALGAGPVAAPGITVAEEMARSGDLSLDAFKRGVRDLARGVDPRRERIEDGGQDR